MNKVEEIFKAWQISYNPNFNQADLAADRIIICDNCEFSESVNIGTLEFFKRCKICNCVLKGKIYTPKTYLDEGGSCPKVLWKDVEDQYLSKIENKKI